MTYDSDFQDYLEKQHSSVLENVSIVTPEDTKEKYMLHITPTKVRKYIPRHPESAADSETTLIPRITVSDNILGCIIGYTTLYSDILNGEMFNPEYKNGYYIYGLAYKYALKPKDELVYGASKSNEYWLVNYSKETTEYTPVLLGKLIPTHVSITPKSDTVEDEIIVTLYAEVNDENGMKLADHLRVGKGYYRIVLDLSRYSLSKSFKGKRLSHTDSKSITVYEVSKGEYMAKKTGSAALLSHEVIADESMKLMYPIYYRMYGNRRVQNLIAPRLFDFDALPRNSAIHYLTDDDTIDLDTSKLYFAGYPKKLVLEFVDKLSSMEGNPRVRPGIVRNLARDWLMKNRMFRYIPGLYKQITDQMQLVIFNYNYLKVLFRYAPVPMNDYYRWYNHNKTMWDNIVEQTKNTDRNQFVTVGVPTSIPSLGLLRLYSTKTNLAMIRIFDSPEKLFLLEMWKWLNPETRENSLLKDIPTTSMGKINITFYTRDGRVALLNLAYLYSWIKGNENLTEFKTVAQFPMEQIQKLYLKFMMTLQAINPEETIEDSLEEPEDRETQGVLVTRTLDDDDEDEDVDEPDLDEVSEYPGEVGVLGKRDLSVPGSSPAEVAGFKDIELRESNDDSYLVSGIDRQLADIDSELKILEVSSKRDLSNKGIQLDKHGDIIEIKSDDTDILDVPETTEQLKEQLNTAKAPLDSLRDQVEHFADTGSLRTVDYRNAMRDIEQYKNMKDPYGTGKPVIEAMVVKPQDLEFKKEDIELKTNPTVHDTSMLETTLKSYTRDYVRKNMKKHTLSMISSLQRSGVIVRKHEIEVVNSVLGAYEHHILELKPLDGASSRVHFRIPVIEEDGTFMINGNKCTLRKQRVDKPIRKINPTTVGLNSYYGKTFVTVADKKAYSSIDWIYKQIDKASVSDDPHIREVAPGSMFNTYLKAPYIYNALSHRYRSFRAGPVKFHFDGVDINHNASEEYNEAIEKGGKYIGIYTPENSKGTYRVLVTMDEQFYYDDKGLKPLGDIYDILHLDKTKVPMDFSEVSIFGKTVPVGLFLAYHMGFGKLVKLLGVTPRVAETRRAAAVQANEYAITFKDITYVFSKKDKLASLILAGFLPYEKTLRLQESDEFNHKNIYLNLLTNRGLGAIYLREMDIMDQLFVDSITEQTLISMGEPTTFRGLLMRATEMLLTYQSPTSQDTDEVVIRGYERIPGAIYKQLATAIRGFKTRNIAGRSKIEISPYEVWKAIDSDPAKKLVEDINPIQNLKEDEIVTYVGVGGRAKDGLNKESRAYHVNDIGVISEATVDSTEVAVNTYLSASPKFKTMTGIIDKEKDIGAANLVSTSVLLAPGTSRDDAKRANFVSIQQSHTIATVGYHAPIVRTGYESLVSQRTGEVFAYSAENDGKVISIEEKGIVVEYADGTRKGLPLGRVYGRAEGSVYPHDLVTDLKVGQKFTKGDAITYNSGFFEKDWLNPGGIVMKNSLTTKVALCESNQTFEDSCAVSMELSNQLTTRITYTRSFTVDFGQNVRNVAKPGTFVTSKDILLTIEDLVTSGMDIFDAESLETLSRLQKNSPKSNYEGELDRIEVFYHGEKRDMSSSLKSLADRSDRELAEQAKATGKPVVTGRVNDDYRVSGVPLGVDKAEIKFYITVENGVGIGDKCIFSNQMKSVVGEVMNYDVFTETGDKVHALFGYRSILARIVTSPIMIGTTTTLLKVIAQKAVNIYKGSK